MINKSILFGAALGLSTFAVSAGAATNTATTATTSSNPAAAVEVKPTDAQISAALTTANEAEIKAAKAAEKKGVDKEVKEFASHMIAEHKKNLEDHKALVKKLNMKPDMSFPVVADLKKTSASQEAELKKQKGPAFDKTYIDQQDAAHTTLLADLTDKFIPNVENSEMKNFLENTKSHVEAHLTRARNIQTRLTR